VVPIEAPVAGFAAALEPLFAGLEPDVTEENIQSRCRGTALMAVSNKLGSMVLTTGNKSEMSVGYATLYGDMNGGFNPIKDVYKSEVYALARFRNQQRPEGSLGPRRRVIPERIITKAPTAELRENQTDQDSLPPYDALDAILEDLIEHELSVAEVAAKGFDRATVERVQQMLYMSPNTSAARPRRASRSRARTSAATGAIRSPTASGPGVGGTSGSGPRCLACPRCAPTPGHWP
jgi:NAD+ synthase